MGNIRTKNTKILILGTIFILIVLFLLVFLNKGLKEKARKFLDNKKESIVDVVSGQEYQKYSGQVSTYFEGKWILNFSFLYKKDLKISQGTGNESKWFKVIDQNKKNNVTLYFTYEGARGWNAEDYINNIFIDNKDFKIQEVKFLDESTTTIKYVSFEDKNIEYFVEEIKNEKGEPWLAIVENIDIKDEASQNIAIDIIRSFEGK
ncbi:MAG: hypothetical protein QG630_256 [Patescibacteria group bacterium]|nr:hypothetical protein [Patescibacteria group bacterium]